jgi:hypothetical protein
MLLRERIEKLNDRQILRYADHPCRSCKLWTRLAGTVLMSV